MLNQHYMLKILGMGLGHTIHFKLTHFLIDRFTHKNKSYSDIPWKYTDI